MTCYKMLDMGMFAGLEMAMVNKVHILKPISVSNELSKLVTTPCVVYCPLTQHYSPLIEAEMG